MFKKSKIDKRCLILSSIFSAFMSVFLVIGEQMNRTRTISWTLLTALNLLIIALITTPITYFLLSKIHLKTDKKYDIKFWYIFIPLFLISLFVLISCYPGNYNYDVMWQYNAYKTGEYTTHYPVFFCWFLGTFMKVAIKIFGSHNFAVFLFNLMQITCLNAVVSYVIYYLSKRIKNKWFNILLVIFYATNPLYLNMIMSVCHDVGFAAFFALIVIETVKMVEDEGYFKKKTNWLKFISLTFIFCVFRNNGLFAIAPAMILGLFFMKRKRLKFMAIVAIPLAMFIGYNQLVVNNIVSKKESVLRESSNIPVVQIVRALYMNHDEVYNEKFETFFKEGCEFDVYRQYPAISDSWKGCLKTKYIEEHPLEFIEFYNEILLKVPKRFIEAPMLFWLNAYYPFVTYTENPDDNITHWVYSMYSVHNRGERTVKSFNFKHALNVSRKPKIKFIDDLFYKLMVRQDWSRIKVFHILWGGSFTTILLLFAVVYNIYKKRYKYLVPLCFIFGCLLTVLLAPIVYYRYLLPVVLAIPIMFYTILKGSNNDKKVKKAKSK